MKNNKLYKFKHYLIDERGPLNYELGVKHNNSQDLKDLYLFSNGIIIAKLSDVKKWKYNYGPNAYRFEVNQKESIDIDTNLDLILARHLLTK